MRVAMLVGALMFNVLAGLYESGWVLDVSTEPGFSEGGDVHASSDFPPPAWP